jgi:lipoprotein-releasing system permease protein
MIQGRIALLRRGNLQVAFLSGTDEQDFARVSSIPQSIIEGKYTLARTDSVPSLIIGALLANQLQLAPGDTVSLVSPLLIESSIKSFRPTLGVRAVVSGIFYCNGKEYDEGYIYSDLRLARALFSAPIGSASNVDVRMKSISDVGAMKRSLESKFPTCLVQTWYDLHSDLYNIMKMERLSTFVVIGLIVIIAVFNVFASLSMTVVEKQSDIGVMKAFGARSSLIQRIYITQGMIIGLFSTIIGVALGLALCWGQINFGWIKLDGEKYLINALPLTVDAIDVISTSLFALFLTAVAAIFPARRAAETVIMSAIRNE